MWKPLAQIFRMSQHKHRASWCMHLRLTRMCAFPFPNNLHGTVKGCVSFESFYLHCICLRGIMGCLQVFPPLSMEKGCKNHRETLYSSKGKIVYEVGKPCNIYRLWGNPIVIISLQIKAFKRHATFYSTMQIIRKLKCAHTCKTQVHAPRCTVFVLRNSEDLSQRFPH